MAVDAFQMLLRFLDIEEVVLNNIKGFKITSVLIPEAFDLGRLGHFTEYLLYFSQLSDVNRHVLSIIATLSSIYHKY